LEKNDVRQETEISLETPAGADGTSALRTSVSNKKPFVEPAVKPPANLLDVTTFFQGSAALDVAGSA
jgi:hypothetical protein